MLNFAWRAKTGFREAISAINGVVDLDLQGRIRSVNAVFSQLYGAGAERLCGRSLAEIIHPSCKERQDFAKLWQDIAEGHCDLAEIRLARADESAPAVWLRARFYMVRVGGKPVQAAAILSDVTANYDTNVRNKNHMEAVRRSMAVVEFDTQGRLKAANPLFEEMLGMPSAGLVGRGFEELTNEPEKSRRWRQNYEAAIARGESYVDEICWHRRDGSVLWLNCVFNAVKDPSGQPSGMVLFASDVTEAKQRRLKRMDLHARVDSEVSELVKAIGETSHEAGQAASAAHVTSSNVQAVAAGASQLAASVNEISDQVSRAQEVSTSAVNQSQTAISAVQTLSAAAQQIATVVDLIASITSQTNLLALNATIEAARAGDAGKGFAVVAGEVKTLAAQTAKATGDIAANVQAVQRSSEEVRQAIASMAATISDINMISSGISAAVEEQSGLSLDMSRNMHEAADGVAQISLAMESVARLTQAATLSVQEVSSASAAAAA